MYQRSSGKEGMYRQISKELFHIHTWRCKHAKNESDEQYVKKAIELGAKRIVFTDHCPFPGDLFQNRMDMEQLPEYLASIHELKEKYKKEIEILCGLEAEYLKDFHAYYQSLKEIKDIDLLILGQHFYEHESGGYSFDDTDKSEEYKGLCEAMIAGIRSSFFDVLAHPDRAFRKRKQFSDSEKEMAEMLIREVRAQGKSGICLEKNYASTRRKNQYRAEFWNLVPKDARVIYGLDAHSTKELEAGWEFLSRIGT